MRRTEIPHHTSEQVAGYIAEAKDIVRRADLHGDLQVPAFVEAIRLLAAKNITVEQVQPGMLGMAPFGGRT